MSEKEEILLKLRKTRKAFLIEYASGAFLLILIVVALSQEIKIPRLPMGFLVGMTVLAFASAEFSRILVRYRITPEKVEIIKGLIRQHKKNVHFHPLGFVPDINVRQNFAQRLLGYGTIFVEGAGGQLEIHDVNNPHSILKLLEERIEKNRTPSTMRKTQ